jgi:hypothetical protein
MGTIHPPALEDAMPRPRANVESARALVQAALERASLGAERADPMRQLLAMRARGGGSS